MLDLIAAKKIIQYSCVCVFINLLKLKDAILLQRFKINMRLAETVCVIYPLISILMSL